PAGAARRRPARTGASALTVPAGRRRPGRVPRRGAELQIAAVLTAYCDAGDRRGRAIAGAAATSATTTPRSTGCASGRTSTGRASRATRTTRSCATGWWSAAIRNTCARVVEGWARIGVDQPHADGAGRGDASRPGDARDRAPGGEGPPAL